jgi:hypothetical protein
MDGDHKLLYPQYDPFNAVLPTGICLFRWRLATQPCGNHPQQPLYLQ